MSGWLLIFFLLILGGVLSTLGDFLGTKIGKARLSIFKLRPRRTAVLITIITGSLISSISLSLILLVDRQLRDGLFRLNDIQSDLKESRLALAPLKKQREVLEGKVKEREKELENLENSLIALRKGQVVISSGESLITSTIQINEKSNVRNEIEKILRLANYNAYKRVKPRELPKERMVLVTIEDVKRIEKIISDKNKWVINIRSGSNIVLGESYFYAFPEVVLNNKIVSKGDILSSKEFTESDLQPKFIDRQIKLLLTSTLAEVKRRGSLVSEIKVDSRSINEIRKDMLSIKARPLMIQVVALRDSETADQISVKLSLNRIAG